MKWFALIVKFIDKRPVFSAVVALFLLLDVIVIGAWWRRPIVDKPEERKPRKVQTVTAEQAGWVELSGKIDKQGVVTVTALSPGVVTYVVSPGQNVGSGQTLASLASTYSGANAAEVSRELAELSLNQVNTSRTDQEEILKLSRRIAEKLQEETGAGGGSIGDMQREQAVRQTDIGKLGINTGVESARLGVRLAEIQAETLRPAAPFAGRVEKVMVKAGEAVSPGMPIAIISAPGRKVEISVNIPRGMNRLVDSQRVEVFDGKQWVKLARVSLSREPVENGMYLLSASVPAEVAGVDGERLAVRVGVGSQGRLIPVDAVFQSETTASVYVVEAREGGFAAVAKEVQVGQIFGDMVAVEGVEAGAKIILDRGVRAGETLEI